ncbi:hypothetical protein [Faecalibaculum rodentium]|uniref:hypothetical protein n=1 Tax=Faecalibaculum rodentium TaxID=1702221 RepID=UPI00272B3B51|nr:hypothetical protein [Faecalibaculum rodentium]
MDKKIFDSALAYAGTSQRQAAANAGISYKGLNNAVNGGTLKQSTIKDICKVIGARYEERIIFPDGQTFTSSD